MSLKTAFFAVASFTDAWIETTESHLESLWNIVASFTDAWIETTIWSVHVQSFESHLLQMRGLKQTASL